MNIEDIQTIGQQLSTRSYLATVGADGTPHVVPVHPGWEGTTMWIMTRRASVKVRNIEHAASVAMHWEVTAAGDGLLVWGRAAVHNDLATRQRLWRGIFDYDLDMFSPDGPENPDTAFISIDPERAVFAKAYGAAGVDRWPLA